MKVATLVYNLTISRFTDAASAKINLRPGTGTTPRQGAQQQPCLDRRQLHEDEDEDEDEDEGDR